MAISVSKRTCVHARVGLTSRVTYEVESTNLAELLLPPGTVWFEFFHQNVVSLPVEGEEPDVCVGVPRDFSARHFVDGQRMSAFEVWGDPDDPISRLLFSDKPGFVRWGIGHEPFGAEGVVSPDDPSYVMVPRAQLRFGWIDEDGNLHDPEAAVGSPENEMVGFDLDEGPWPEMAETPFRTEDDLDLDLLSEDSGIVFADDPDDPEESGAPMEHNPISGRRRFTSESDQQQY